AWGRQSWLRARFRAGLSFALADSLVELIQILLQSRQDGWRVVNQVLHLAGIFLHIKQLIHSLQLRVADILPLVVADGLPARCALLLWLFEVLRKERCPPAFHAAGTSAGAVPRRPVRA